MIAAAAAAPMKPETVPRWIPRTIAGILPALLAIAGWAIHQHVTQHEHALRIDAMERRWLRDDAVQDEVLRRLQAIGERLARIEAQGGK